MIKVIPWFQFLNENNFVLMRRQILALTTKFEWKSYIQKEGLLKLLYIDKRVQWRDHFYKKVTLWQLSWFSRADFNNVELKATTAALRRLGVQFNIVNWITKLLRGKKIYSTKGAKGSKGKPARWGVVRYELTISVDETWQTRNPSLGGQHWTDHFGRFVAFVKNNMQPALKRISVWASERGLNINSDQTVVVFFTRKYKPSSFRPLTLYGVILNSKTRHVFWELPSIL